MASIFSFYQAAALSLLLTFCATNTFSQEAIPTISDRYKNTVLILNDGMQYFERKSYINAYNRSEEALEDAINFGYADLELRARELWASSRKLMKESFLVRARTSIDLSDFDTARFYIQKARDINFDNDVTTVENILKARLSLYNSRVVPAIVFFYEGKYTSCVAEFEKIKLSIPLHKKEQEIYLIAKEKMSLLEK